MEPAPSLGPVQPALPSCPPQSDADNTLTTVEDICGSFFVDSAVESRYDDALDEPAQNQALPSDETLNKQICNDGPTAPPQAKRGTSKKNKRRDRDIDELMMSTLTENRKRLHQLNSSVEVDADELFLLSLKPMLAKINEKQTAVLKLKMHEMLVEAAFPSSTESTTSRLHYSAT